MPAVGDAFLQHQFHEFLSGWTHILKALTEGHDREAHTFKVLDHLDGSPAVESNLADIESFAQPLDEFLDVAVVDHIALKRFDW